MKHLKYEQPKIYMSREVFQTIQFFVDNHDKEISGLGVVIPHPEKNGYIVTEVKLIKQEVSSVTTDLCEEATAKAVYDHAMSGKEGELCHWWHSHVNMGVMWSSTDVDTIETMGQHSLCVATVHNKRGEVKGAIKEVTPNGLVHYYDNVPIVIIDNLKINKEELLTQIKELVTEKVYNYNYNYGKANQAKVLNGTVGDDLYETDFFGKNTQLSMIEGEQYEHEDLLVDELDPNPKGLLYDDLIKDKDYRAMKYKIYSEMDNAERSGYKFLFDNFVKSEAYYECNDLPDYK